VGDAGNIIIRKEFLVQLHLLHWAVKRNCETRNRCRKVSTVVFFVSYHLKIQEKGTVRFITSNVQGVTKYFYTL